jgi:hypothetical protein
MYLDGGVVPIALALEEMGITRHGSVKSLFEKAPVENLDLKTYTNTNKSYNPAKYIMITGDSKLSPNNVVDLQAATNKNNVNGDKVKVILISQAGSEGLDFKFIRQIHIIEPWYNLSRIEQIIGRGVRHCSHKDLPFEKRNVQIFLYGSELIDDREEAADLYVYRLAETKAVKIGDITRVLKEISVDCLLNSGQQNFSAENMQQVVKQKLSDGMIIDYSVGDKPYTAQCDYMNTCLYKCKPENTIGPINEFSYSEAFIEMNTEKIIHRIKQLMKERYFYEKRDLIAQINVIREYPDIQIYAALNYLVTDKNEFLMDKYDRMGHLVNIGNYYFFQPSELNNEHLSIYDRSIPIPFKRHNIPVSNQKELSKQELESLTISSAVQKIETDIAENPELSPISKDLDIDKSVKQIEKPPQSISIPVKVSTIVPTGKLLLNRMNIEYNTSTSKQTIIRGDKDIWYKYSSIILDNLEKRSEQKEVLNELLISHIIETRLFEDLMNILNYLYTQKPLTNFETKIQNYFEYHSLNNKGITGLLLQGWDSVSKKPNQKLIIFDNTKWKLAESEDYRDLLPAIEKNIVPNDKLNNLFGFISNFKNILMIFKVKENKPGNAGARCDQGGKTTAERLNYIVGNKQYTEADLKNYPAAQLCVLQEYLLRLKDHKERGNKDSKRWFLTPAESVIANTKK